tara:strand:- start:535 stop:1035 length:501 start_codon:yes stop_codon:yes gene_type:complete
MADDTKIRNFANEIREVKEEYGKDSFEYSIPNSFVLTVATAETGNMEFVGAPTAKKAKNYFGIHPIGDDDFLPTGGGAKLRKFENSKDSIRAFLKLISTGSAYDNVRKSIEQGQPVEKLFMNMGSYAEKSDYPQFLNTVYRTRVNEILNPILPKRKPLNAQMKGLN